MNATMTKSEKIEQAISAGNLSTYKGRYVGPICQLARIAGVAPGSIHYARNIDKVRAYEQMGAVLVIDAQDLADYFRYSRRGRKPRNKSEVFQNSGWKSQSFEERD